MVFEKWWGRTAHHFWPKVVSSARSPLFVTTFESAEFPLSRSIRLPIATAKMSVERQGPPPFTVVEASEDGFLDGTGFAALCGGGGPAAMAETAMVGPVVDNAAELASDNGGMSLKPVLEDGEQQAASKSSSRAGCPNYHPCEAVAAVWAYIAMSEYKAIQPMGIN